jgi:molybdate transport system substrate-binding protein
MTRLVRTIRRVLPAWVLALAAGSAAAAELTVSAAASLTRAFKDIAAAFEAANPETRVRLNFGASGALLQQIARGAPVDVFAAADQETMQQAERQQLVRPGAKADFAGNALVVVVPHDAAATPKTLADLTGPAVKKVAIGLPASVPVGRYTRSALEKANLWTRIEARMIGAQTVRQALDYVARGEVDAGFVYATDAAILPGKVRIAFVVPTETPLVYPIATLAAASNPQAAQKSVAFVLSPAGQAVLVKHGFRRP